MITRGIVEKIIDQYSVKVRIPILDKVGASDAATPTDELNTAVMCPLPACSVRGQVGDVVFVAFENGGLKKALILGYLYRSEMTDTYCDMVFGSLKTVGETQLSPYTSIGDISPREISTLKVAKDNLQGQIDTLYTTVQYLLEYLKLDNTGG